MNGNSSDSAPLSSLLPALNCWLYTGCDTAFAASRLSPLMMSVITVTPLFCAWAVVGMTPPLWADKANGFVNASHCRRRRLGCS